LFILPVGHEKGTVRRLPWITFAIMALCFVIHLLFSGSEREQVQRILEARRNLGQCFYSNPQVDLTADAQEILFGHLPDQQRRAYLEAVRGSAGTGPAGRGMNEPGRRAELSRVLARRVAAVHAAEKATTVRRWGLIPSHPSLTGIFGHMFLHGGWIHLLGNLFILYLAGPFIEDVWGRGVFAAFYLLSGLGAATLFCLLHPGVNVPLIGASGAIAGVMGAFLVRYARTQIDFVYVFLLMGTGRFSAPALTMLPLWFVEQLFMSFMAEDSPGGGGVAYSAHVGGFAFGVGVALALKHYRAEERWLRPAIDKQVNHILLEESALDQALALRADGDVDAALTLMSAEARRRPSDPYLALAFWAVAGEENRAAEAAPALLALVRRELSAGHEDEAVEHWRKLLAALPDPDADPALLVKIGRLLVGRGETRDGAAAFRLALLDRGNRLTPSLALALGRAAREFDPNLARVAARWVMSRPEATEAARAGADTILAGLPTTPPPR
jgi:membrane associated rhomboid family serine protease